MTYHEWRRASHRDLRLRNPLFVRMAFAVLVLGSSLAVLAVVIGVWLFGLAVPGLLVSVYDFVLSALRLSSALSLLFVESIVALGLAVSLLFEEPWGLGAFALGTVDGRRRSGRPQTHTAGWCPDP